MNFLNTPISDPTEILPLWPASPPGGDGLKLCAQITEHSPDTRAYHNRTICQIQAPHLAVFRPQKPNGTAMLIAPGGGYSLLWFDKEGYETAPFLNAAGITVFVLISRLPGEGWANQHNVPLQDGQRAMRLIRARADTYGLDPHRIGVMGFSAGGHLAASLLTRSGEPVYAPQDAADNRDARPDFAALLYPVITMDTGTHPGSREHLLGTGAEATESVPEASCENLVTGGTAPTFISLAANDTTVPPWENGIAFFHALQKRRVPSDLHIFEKGGHGFAIREAGELPCAIWPKLFTDWLASHGFTGNI